MSYEIGAVPRLGEDEDLRQSAHVVREGGQPDVTDSYNRERSHSPSTYVKEVSPISQIATTENEVMVPQHT